MPGFYQLSEDDFDPQSNGLTPPVLAKERRYKHFDLPLTDEERDLDIDFRAEQSPHRFWPMLGFDDITRRYKRDPVTGKAKAVSKIRPIRFASHADAAYLQAYAAYLGGIYERALASDGTTKCVLAYRSATGTNIHHSKSLFDEIRSRQDCSVFAMDISGFFDCLNHQILRDEIASILGSQRLTGHHGTVWKNITKYS